MMMAKPTVVDLFSGVGGFSLGFEQAGFDVVAAVELDKVAAYYHSLNFPQCRVIVDDIRNVTGQDILNVVERDRIDVVIGGSPCQGFSIAGNNCAQDTRNTLTSEFCRVVTELYPKYFVFENVAGMTYTYGQQFLTDMTRQLQAAGYEIAPINILNAKDYGVAQDRKRVIMLGWRGDCAPIKYPLPLAHKVTVREALHNMGENPITTKHSPKVIERFKQTPPGQRDKISRCHKLQLDGFSPTLKAGTGSDRGNFTAVRPIHPTEDRVITIKEAARLHSYPDSFQFHSVTMWALRQIGNSVCPNFARAIASEVMKGFTLPTVSESTTKEDSVLFSRWDKDDPSYDDQWSTMSASDAAGY